MIHEKKELLIDFLKYVAREPKEPSLKDLYNYINKYIEENNTSIEEYSSLKNTLSERIYLNKGLSMYMNNNISKICFFLKDKNSIFLCSNKNVKYDSKKKIYLCEKHKNEKNYFFEKIIEKDFFKCEFFFGDKKFNKNNFFILSEI